ncbi:MAG: DNA phosphorothioation system sulfurtransferase DndC [Carboxydocellales bacterium]
MKPSISKEAIELIKNVYLADTRPWVVGYSGGKDSTTVVQLIFYAILDLPPEKRQKPIYIISSDTLIETPLIINYIDTTLQQIQKNADQKQLPIKTVKVQPTLDQSFWVSLIGKGYPTPRQKFRWCTDRLKIEPANKFILNKVSQFGEVIVVLGVRKAESATRSQVMNIHKVEGKILRKHTTLMNAYVFAPIEDFNTDDVWRYLLQYPSPWGADNNQLLALYQDSQAGECPLVIDNDTPSCGNSRFGCWVCTVVKEDKALMGFIESGHEYLTPLLEYRNWLQEIRDNPDFREKKRMNGSVYFINRGDERHIGLGPFTLGARQEMLRRLLQTEKIVGNKLIKEEELKLIRKIWLDVGDWEDTLPKIFAQVYQRPLNWDFNERPLFTKDELQLIDQLCVDEGLDPELLRKLINLELKHYGYKHRHGILKNMEKLLNQDWVHINDVEGVAK